MALGDSASLMFSSPKVVSAMNTNSVCELWNSL